MTDRQLHYDPAVNALIDRERRAAAISALREAAEEGGQGYTGALSGWEAQALRDSDWRRFLSERADMLEAS